MARLLPSTPDLSAAEDAEPRVIGIDGDDADDLLAAMSSSTARELLMALHDQPAAPSELADRVGTSLQNAQYHLRNLEEAGVIEIIDTVYSEKGREMKVYAPSDRPLVVVAGGSSETASLRSALVNLMGGLGILGIMSYLLHVILSGQAPIPVGQTGGAGADGGAGGGMVMAEAETARTAAVATTGLPPGLLFFAGGALVLTVGFVVWYWRSRSR